MVNERKISEIISHCGNAGYQIRVRDIAYAFLLKHISDKTIAYKCVFGQPDSEKEVDSYHNSTEISYLRSYIDYNVEPKQEKKKGKKGKDDDLISFEENRAAMVDLLTKTQVAMDNGEIEPKDGLKILADLRVKLNDKFNVNEVVKDQLVIVEPKYNMICERFNCECYLPTKNDLIEMYNLKETEE